ncbi:Hypothetical predicted protein [Octopus vulgaris]|uniref:Uncharacterized protein n=1 Tax=Octopus vulgaris TaxID=6645 RepID=A0AA36FHS2_OCTVU|nr:Hypothetical predicted protein [Octopus vulgaris]
MRCRYVSNSRSDCFTALGEFVKAFDRLQGNNNDYSRDMIGAAGSRHVTQRRRASLAFPHPTPHQSVFNNLQEDGEEIRLPTVPRRRVVDTSDLRTCAILQTRLKNVKHYPEMNTFSADSGNRDDSEYTHDGSLSKCSLHINVKHCDDNDNDDNILAESTLVRGELSPIQLVDLGKCHKC